MERAVGTAKGLLQNTSDPHLALLSFQATPLPWCSLSPAELLFRRKINTDLPQSNGQLVPQWPYLKDFCRADKEHKATQQLHYNSRHRARPLPSLAPEDPVWVKTGARKSCYAFGVSQVIHHCNSHRPCLPESLPCGTQEGD